MEAPDQKTKLKLVHWSFQNPNPEGKNGWRESSNLSTPLMYEDFVYTNYWDKFLAAKYRKTLDLLAKRIKIQIHKAPLVPPIAPDDYELTIEPKIIVRYKKYESNR